MAKTIKEIADELGVDKQKVYRYIKKNRINEAHHEVLCSLSSRQVKYLKTSADDAYISN